VATSVEPTDDPLAAYVRELGLAVFRGPLANVFRRFQLCLEAYPCTWFFRICADSPLLQEALLPMVLEHSSRSDLDLVTNVFPRTFPKGRVKCSGPALPRFRRPALGRRTGTCDKYYYNNPDRFRILNLDSGDPKLGQMSYVVDTIDDIQRLEGMAPDGNLLEEYVRKFL
jgi:spore coat polysaccharide biosynthesis protein SpsF (cytidylyltransferase family)